MKKKRIGTLGTWIVRLKRLQYYLGFRNLTKNRYGPLGASGELTTEQILKKYEQRIYYSGERFVFAGLIGERNVFRGWHGFNLFFANTSIAKSFGIGIPFVFLHFVFIKRRDGACWKTKNNLNARKK